MKRLLLIAVIIGIIGCAKEPVLEVPQPQVFRLEFVQSPNDVDMYYLLYRTPEIRKVLYVKNASGFIPLGVDKLSAENFVNTLNKR